MNNHFYIIIFLCFFVFLSFCLIIYSIYTFNKIDRYKNKNNARIITAEYNKNDKMIQFLFDDKTLNENKQFLSWFPYDKIRLDYFTTLIISDNLNKIKKILLDNVDDDGPKICEKNNIEIILLLNKIEEKFIFNFLKKEKNYIYFSLYYVNSYESLYENQKNAFHKLTNISNLNIHNINDFNKIIQYISNTHDYSDGKSIFRKGISIFLYLKINNFNSLLKEFGKNKCLNIKQNMAWISANSLGPNASAFYSKNYDAICLLWSTRKEAFDFINKIKQMIIFKRVLNKINKQALKFYPLTDIKLSCLMVFHYRMITEKSLKSILLYANTLKIKNQNIVYKKLLKSLKLNKNVYPQNIGRKLIERLNTKSVWVPVIDYKESKLVGNLYKKTYFYGGSKISDVKILKNVMNDLECLKSKRFISKFYLNAKKIDEQGSIIFVIYDILLFSINSKLFMQNVDEYSKKITILFKNFQKIRVSEFKKYTDMLSWKKIDYGLYDFDVVSDYKYIWSCANRPKFVFLKKKYSTESIINKNKYFYLKSFTSGNLDIIVVIVGLSKVESTMYFIDIGINYFEIASNNSIGFMNPISKFTSQFIRKYSLDYNKIILEEKNE